MFLVLLLVAIENSRSLSSLSQPVIIFFPCCDLSFVYSREEVLDFQPMELSCGLHDPPRAWKFCGRRVIAALIATACFLSNFWTRGESRRPDNVALHNRLDQRVAGSRHAKLKPCVMRVAWDWIWTACNWGSICYFPQTHQLQVGSSPQTNLAPLIQPMEPEGWVPLLQEKEVLQSFLLVLIL